MKKASIRINIEAELQQQAEELFSSLGLSMSDAVNLFLHQCVLNGKLPFSDDSLTFSDKTLDAMDEAKSISRNSSIPGFSNMADLNDALLR